MALVAVLCAACGPNLGGAASPGGAEARDAPVAAAPAPKPPAGPAVPTPAPSDVAKCGEWHRRWKQRERRRQSWNTSRERHNRSLCGIGRRFSRQRRCGRCGNGSDNRRSRGQCSHDRRHFRRWRIAAKRRCGRWHSHDRRHFRGWRLAAKRRRGWWAPSDWWHRWGKSPRPADTARVHALHVLVTRGRLRIRFRCVRASHYQQ